MGQTIKCRLCDHTVNLWTTTKKGNKKQTGFERLRSHYLMEHEEEYKELLEKHLGDLDSDDREYLGIKEEPGVIKTGRKQ